MRSCYEQQAAYLERDPQAREHVPACPVCSRAQPELDRTLGALADESAWAEPSPTLEERLMAAVHEDAAAATDWVAPWDAVISSGDDPAGTTYGLVATDMALSARGTVTVRSTPSGNEFKLDLRGLPRAEPGSLYQAWVRSSAGELVPIGTFHTGDDEIVLWSGVDIERYPTLTVTLEPADDNQASSGVLVLAAELSRAR